MPNTIITGMDGFTIGGAIHGSTLHGLWFAGLPGVNGKIQSIQAGIGSTIENCIFINLPEAIDGLTDNCVIQDCVFINCGWGTLSHSVYYNDSQSAHHLLKDNIFIGGLAYHIHLWHDPSNVTIQGNFSARSTHSLVMQGNGHGATNNFLWSTNGITCNFSSGNYTFHNNYIGSDVSDASDVAGCYDNTFYGSIDFGTNPTHKSWDEFATKTGYTKAQIDNAAYFLDNAKTFTRDQLLADTTIAANVAIIKSMMSNLVA